ncbi:MAG: hypothetical protein FWC39_05570 [Bacteroidetes bacterium]|nr:hypothetical protein [Bacteroidota bacterium]
MTTAVKKQIKPVTVKKQTDDLLKLILKKTGTKHSEIVAWAERKYIKANLDVVTANERKQFDQLIFGL